MKFIYSMVIRFPKVTVALVLGITVYLAMQLPGLRWETDARVYLPKGHPAIKYDEKVDDVFGVKDSVIIGIVNDKEGIFNPVTLDRVARITKKIAALPGVIANRPVDVASLSTATIFTGTNTTMGAEPLMPQVPKDPGAIARLKKTIYDNSDLFVGNLVSADGKATMIRARLKEGESNRYMTYWQIKGIIAAEGGDAGGSQAWGQGSGGWNGQSGTDGSSQSGSQGWQQSGAGGWQQGAGKQDTAAPEKIEKNDDKFYLAGRPVIEVTSGLQAIKDMQIMIPLVLLAIGATLFVIFRTARGVVLPLFVMGASIVWTMGIMVLANVPLYTISTMLPVILVAVSIGDSVHLLSSYYDQVLHNAHSSGREIVREIMSKLSMPLLVTSLTTAVGFMSFGFAQMPPFVVFGIFTVLGISLSWLLTVTFIPAMLVLMKPKVGSYLAKRRSLRVHAEQNRLTKILVDMSVYLHDKRHAVTMVLIVIAAVAALGASKLYVDSSWMSDFHPDSDVVVANKMFNKEFDGTIFLNAVVEGNQKNILTSPELLRRIEGLQNYVKTLPYVGGARSIVDYIKNMNKTLHAGDEKYNVIPDTQAQIGEYFFLLSISGRPQLLDEVVDYDYRQGLITVAIKTDKTKELKAIIDKTRAYIAENFAGQNVEVHFAGSANNSYVWADLLIGSQTSSILISKISIFLIALLILRSFRLGLIMIIPLTMTTLIVAGIAGFLGIPLDVSTALAAGIAIGVGVDYAVHYIFRYQDELAQLGDPLLATQATMRSVGRTIVFNGLVVTIGFAVLFASQFPPNVKLGYFVVSYMVISCVMSLTILPVLFAYARVPVPRQETVHATT